jgi:hypothetical protein
MLSLRLGFEAEPYRVGNQREGGRGLGHIRYNGLQVPKFLKSRSDWLYREQDFRRRRQSRDVFPANMAKKLKPRPI